MNAPLVVWIGEAKSTLLSTVEKKYSTYSARSGKRGLELAKEHTAHIVVLDAVSLHTSGERIMASLRQELPKTVLIHIQNGKPVKSDADIILNTPLTGKRLLTSLSQALNPPKRNIITCGAFVLDLDQRTLHANDADIALNPKQCKLLEIFFRRPNEVLERAWIMKQVWQTDYTGDTRTLDVHIRWVRCALEGKNAKNPKFLKTIRGVGYCLDVKQNEAGV
jgi:DNA-binding response OmpR family regulator